MSEEQKDVAPVAAANPKIILQELEKSAAEVDLPSAQEVPIQIESLPEAAKGVTLITQSMRRLDELLAQFRK